jgi:hypothetical protein
MPLISTYGALSVRGYTTGNVQQATLYYGFVIGGTGYLGYYAINPLLTRNIVGSVVDPLNGSEYRVIYVNGSGSGNYVYVVKVNSSGVLQWQKQLSSTYSASPASVGTTITVDSSNNVIIGGTSDQGIGTEIYKISSAGATIFGGSSINLIVNAPNVYNQYGNGPVCITSVTYTPFGGSTTTEHWVATQASTGPSIVDPNQYGKLITYNSTGTPLQWYTLSGTQPGYIKKMYIPSGGLNAEPKHYHYVGNTLGNDCISRTSFNIGWHYSLETTTATRTQNYIVDFIIDSSNNSYILSTSKDGATNYIVITKLNSSGTVQWIQETSTNWLGANMTVFNITRDNSGYLYVIFNIAGNGTFIVKLDSVGTLVFYNRITPIISPTSFFINESGNRIIITTGLETYSFPTDGTNPNPGTYTNNGTYVYQRVFGIDILPFVSATQTTKVFTTSINANGTPNFTNGMTNATSTTITYTKVDIG